MLAALTATNGVQLITAAQIRAARALLNWSGQQLADRCGVSYPTVYRAETSDGIPNIQARNLAKIRDTLEDAGVLFLDTHMSRDGGPGVRLRSPHAK